MDIIIILNNYFHDVATAFLLSSAVIMWVLGRRAAEGGAAELSVLARAYPTLTRFAWGALAWIVIGGIPRVIFFKTHEFIPAQESSLVTVLAVKHALMALAVVAGAVMWRRARRMIGDLSQEKA